MASRLGEDTARASGKRAILNRRGIAYSIECGNHKESDVKEAPSLPRRKKYDVRLTPLVVQFSDSCRTAAPHLSEAPDQAVPPGRTDVACPAVPPKDDIVGWPGEMPVEPPDFAAYPLDSSASF